MTSRTSRSLLVGVATGMRSSAGAVAAAHASGRRRLLAAAAAMAAGELVVDKLPATPSRLAPGSLAVRLVLGAVGAGALAARAGEGVVLPAVLGAVGAGAGSRAGAGWRDHTARRGLGAPGAVAEDLAAAGLLGVVVRVR